MDRGLRIIEFAGSSSTHPVVRRGNAEWILQILMDQITQELLLPYGSYFLTVYFCPALIFQAVIFSPRQIPVFKNTLYLSHNLSKNYHEIIRNYRLQFLT